MGTITELFYKGVVMKKATIRNAAEYNIMLGEVKKAMANGVSYYKVTELRNNSLYGGVECYDQTAAGAYVNRNGQVFSNTFENSVGTIFTEGNYQEEPIKNISKDVALRAIRLALKEAFKAPSFVGNDGDCPSDDDGTWWNNHRLVPSCTIVEVNDRKWIIYYQD